MFASIACGDLILDYCFLDQTTEPDMNIGELRRKLDKLPAKGVVVYCELEVDGTTLLFPEEPDSEFDEDDEDAISCSVCDEEEEEEEGDDDDEEDTEDTLPEDDEFSSSDE